MTLMPKPEGDKASERQSRRSTGNLPTDTPHEHRHDNPLKARVNRSPHVLTMRSLLQQRTTVLRLVNRKLHNRLSRQKTPKPNPSPTQGKNPKESRGGKKHGGGTAACPLSLLCQ